MNGCLRRLLAAPTWLYRLHAGWLLGHRFLLLIHTGRRTGQRYRTVLEVLRYRPDGPEAVVLSGFGRDAGWLCNIRTGTRAEVVIGTRRFAASHRILDDREAVAVFAGYEQRHRLVSPIIRAVLSRLVGWQYHGTEADRRRFAAQLPMIAFRPL